MTIIIVRLPPNNNKKMLTENFDTEDWNTIAIFEAKRCARRTKIGSKFYVFISKSLFGVDRSRVVRPPKRMNETVEQIYTDNTE